MSGGGRKRTASSGTRKRTVSSGVRKRAPRPRDRRYAAFTRVCPKCGEEVPTHILKPHCASPRMEREAEKLKDARGVLTALAFYLPHLQIHSSR